MLKRTGIFHEEMLNDLRVIADFSCGDWNCDNCPMWSDSGVTGCASLEVKRMLDRYDNGKEVIY